MTRDRINEMRDAYRSLWGCVGVKADAPCAGCGGWYTRNGRCVECDGQVIGAVCRDCDVAPCHICGSYMHDSCGFCSHCKEHTTFVIGDDGERVSECCGAGGNAYDEGIDLAEYTIGDR